MRMKILAGVILLFLIALSVDPRPCRAAEPAQLPKELKVCDGGNEWPPYAFFKRVSGEKTQEVVGFSVDYLNAILAGTGIAARIDLLPWKRCQYLVSTGEYDMLLNASFSRERAEKYLISQKYYELTGVYFYSKKKEIERITKPSLLDDLYICGELGYNYRNFGVDDANVDASYQNLGAAMERIKTGNCDIVLTDLEIARAQGLVGERDFSKDPDLRFETLPYMKLLSFHMMVSRRPAYAKTLLDLLNEGIERLQKSNLPATIMSRYAN